MTTWRHHLFSHIQTLLTEMVTNSLDWSTPLSIMPVHFGTFANAEPLPVLNSRAMYNSEFASYAFQASQFSWVVYNFSHGHFTSTIESANLSLRSVLGVIPHRGIVLYLANLLQTHGYLAPAMTFWIIFALPATSLSFMGIWSIRFGFVRPRFPKRSGTCNCRLSPNYVLYVQRPWWLRSLSQILMAPLHANLSVD